MLVLSNIKVVLQWLEGGGSGREEGTSKVF